MAPNSKKGAAKTTKPVQKPQATKKELSEKERGKVSGGFNPQPDPPRRH